MHVLLVGNGGREHAMAWKLAHSTQVSRISVAPGNTGISLENKVSLVSIGVSDQPALLDYAIKEKVDLTIVGPELPLVEGLVDLFRAENLAILGPTAAAAQLEGSKAFAKQFMQRHNIPTSAYATFSDAPAAHAYLETQSAPVVIKADGLAAGKGVVVALEMQQAHDAIDAMLSDSAFGSAGSTVVIEDFLRGEEASFIALVDGKNCLPFATSQDHKARDDGDKGPNTGGMGAYSPAPVVTQQVQAHVMRDIVQPTVAGMRADGTPFTGFLYVGLMIHNGQARVVEYNVRLGDPETQPLMMRLQSDFFELCQAAVSGTLDNAESEWKPGSAIGVVMAAGDYPQSGSKGEVITGIDNAERHGSKVFHAGTASKDGELVTNGGRVLCVTATGSDIKEAKTRADESVTSIHWNNVHYRSDIGYRAVARLEKDQA